MTVSALRIGVLLPELLAVGGDRGNVVVLAHRLRARGHTVELVEAGLGTPVPESLDLYLLGGAEDPAQLPAADHLRRDPGLARAVDRGTPVFAAGAGITVLGHRLTAADGRTATGPGLLDAETVHTATRGTGETVVEPDPATGLRAQLSGFANRTGVLTLGPAARPLGRVVRGVGNDPRPDAPGPAVEGAVQGPIVATGLQGPVLARNPELADLVLAAALGVAAADLAPLPMPSVQRLRTERLRA